MFWILVAAGFLSLIYLYVTQRLQHWKNRHVPQHSVTQILLQNVAQLMQTQATSEFLKGLYYDFPDQRYFGSYVFLSPALVIRDPELIKQITVKDFDHFADRAPFFTEETEPAWGKNLVSLSGEKWKGMRMVLSPSFTGLKLKTMSPLIITCIKQFLNHLEKNDNRIIEIEAKDVFKKLACDVIATSAFGVSRDSFKDPNNDFFVMASKMITLNFRAFLRIACKMIFPKLSNILNIHIMDESVTRFFGNIIKENIKARESLGIVRPDMIQLLIEARRKTETLADSEKDESDILNEYKDKENKVKKMELTDDYIVGQALIFFFAGHEGLSTAMSFLAYELAVNPEVQEKLYDEIKENINTFGTDPTYENLMSMKYLDMVLSENMRKAFITPTSDRICTKPYTIQPKNANEKPIHLKVGDGILFSSNPIHSDPKFWPNPDRFDPERFSDENKSKIVPGTYSPFGMGPRHCIGIRFAIMEIKLVYFYLLANYKIVVIDKTPIPLKLAKQPFTVNAEGGFWVGLQKRSAAN